MCRWLAYQGDPILLEDLVCAPAHSLVAQSLRAEEGKEPTNGDGFGLGWYGERAAPGLYREVRPAWSDENLRSLCQQVRSALFFAHVRASTGTAIARANCHPFAHGRLMFMHNGQIGGYAAIRRQVEAMIPDEVYGERAGTTDSEAIFLAAIGMGLAAEPVAALARTLNRVGALMRTAGLTQPLRFTAALADGRDVLAVRWASDDRAPTLYYRERGGSVVIVSEPLDAERACWREVPKGCAVIARAGAPVELRCMNEAMRAAA